MKANQEWGSTHRYYILVSNHSMLVWKMIFSYYLSVCQKENKLFLKEYKALHSLLLFSYMIFIICSEIVRYAMLPTRCLQQTCKIFKLFLIKCTKWIKHLISYFYWILYHILYFILQLVQEIKIKICNNWKIGN